MLTWVFAIAFLIAIVSGWRHGRSRSSDRWAEVEQEQGAAEEKASQTDYFSFDDRVSP